MASMIKLGTRSGLMLGLIAAPVGASPPAAALIRTLRLASNGGIAAHDPARATTLLDDDVYVLTSGGKLLHGRTAMRAAFATIFQDPDFVTFLRQTRHVRIGKGVATESGQWLGRWRERRVTGSYFARWELGENGWRVMTESFVPLSCRGKSCG